MTRQSFYDDILLFNLALSFNEMDDVIMFSIIIDVGVIC